ncbi:MAG: IS21 family transposase [Candidatus Accumulibacter sp.]|uniref:IS21 family transposase n=1 Tax=Candidatus Accumulibacter affinis TaxID=2954384 RepID=A0A935T993_9PROT|nr:IS21 family transposase [Candidatus Accumulibacter affinis]
MITYELYCRIQDGHARQGLTVAQIARALGLHEQTVVKWLACEQFHPRQSAPRSSRLDPFKDQVIRLLETHPYSAQQIYQRLRESGFEGGFTIVKDYVRRVRPVRREAFLKLSFAPAEAAQVDWGEYGTIGVGSTRRRLSFFVMVLCYSRLMYVEFTVSQTMEHFLAAHEHAFAAFGGCPGRLMIDNLKSAVLSRAVGEAPVFNPLYLDFARHWGFAISPCNVAKGNEKGRVENGVGYVKKNLLNGADFLDFSAVNPAAEVWLANIANVRVHGETHQRPVDRFKDEQGLLQPLNPLPYDLGRIQSQRASKQFRVALDSNHYSVPAEFASQRVTLKAYPDRVCIYHQDKLIARHLRSYDRHQDIEDPDHPKALLAQRRNAREQRLLVQFLSLSRHAQVYLEGIEQRRMNPRHHLRKIVALSEIHGVDAVDRAIQDGIAFAAYSCEYIANILEMRARDTPEPGALHLTRRQDLLDLEIAAPDLSPYERQSDGH